MHATAAGHMVAWALLAALGAADIAGYTFDLYRLFWWFDRLLHAGTILALTLWLALFVWALKEGPDGALLRFLLIMSAGVALGTVWEVAEWRFGQLVPGDVIKGKNDTLLDIIMDTAAAGGRCRSFVRPVPRA
jgi:hypothetical protein